LEDEMDKEKRERLEAAGHRVFDTVEEFFDALDEDFARLQSDPAAWQEYLREQALWDSALADGLEDE
jgi:hypothetical protein